MTFVWFSIALILLVSVDCCYGTVSCAVCPLISIDLTTDTDLNTDGCRIEGDEMCTLSLRVDYINSNNSFAVLDGVKDAPLLLTNGEPQVTDSTFIWFNEVRVQRIASIICFASASCGVDILKAIYRDKYRPFDYENPQKMLAEKFYSNSAVQTDLRCMDPNGQSVSCADGFCRSIFDANGLVSYSSCVKTGSIAAPYGLTVSHVTMPDVVGDQSTIIFTCNKPNCNSKEMVNDVLKMLADAKIIPTPTITTTLTPSPTTKSSGKSLFSNGHLTLFVFFLFFRV